MSTAIAVHDTPCSLGVPPANLFFACADQDWVCHAADTEKQGQRSYEAGRMGRCAGCSGQSRAALGQIDSYFTMQTMTAFLDDRLSSERHKARDSAETIGANAIK
jgi:hypothetical protein